MTLSEQIQNEIKKEIRDGATSINDEIDSDSKW